MLEKAKGPATAAGVALLGVAGGIAASRNGSSGRGPGLPSALKPKSGLSKAMGKVSLPKPKSGLSKALDNVSLPKPDDVSIDWVEDKAKMIGKAGFRVAELTTQARMMKKAISGDND